MFHAEGEGDVGVVVPGVADAADAVEAEGDPALVGRGALSEHIELAAALGAVWRLHVGPAESEAAGPHAAAAGGAGRAGSVIGAGEPGAEAGETGAEGPLAVGEPGAEAREAGAQGRA